MCVEPTRLDDGTEVRCRFCWQCQADRINDLVGRCIAESHSSGATYSVTLTYRESEENAARVATLVYRDVQLFLKRLRKRGHKVRYICAGEYGSTKGRAHWHIILFFQDRGPKQHDCTCLDKRCTCKRDRWSIVPSKRLLWEPWPHGFVFFQPQPDYEGLRYALKYTLKDLEQAQYIGHLAMSKKPVLGFQFIHDMARDYVAAGLAPQTPYYKLGNQYNRNSGKLRRFRLWGRSADILCEEFTRRWWAQHDREPPPSEFLFNFESRTGFSVGEGFGKPLTDDEKEHVAQLLRNMRPYRRRERTYYREDDDEVDFANSINYWWASGYIPTDPEFEVPQWLYDLSQASPEPLKFLVCEPDFGKVHHIEVKTDEGPRLWYPFRVVGNPRNVYSREVSEQEWELYKRCVEEKNAAVLSWLNSLGTSEDPIPPLGSDW